MKPREAPVVFDCVGEQLVGVATMPDAPSEVGLLIVVGGPQYRVGSHRQFVQLARFLAVDGIPSLRFDYRGMGDSGGGVRSFEDVEADVLAATRAFREVHPGLRRPVLFGLCDAASVTLMAAEKIEDLAGMILANPWVRVGEESLNAAVVRHYYRKRLFSGEFWRKVAAGRLPVASVATEFIGRVSRLVRGNADLRESANKSFVDRMRKGWQLPVRKLLLMSGQDLTAREFEDLRAKDQRWACMQAAEVLLEVRLPLADHTFSQSGARDEMHLRCRDFLLGLAREEPSVR